MKNAQCFVTEEAGFHARCCTLSTDATKKAEQCLSQSYKFPRGPGWGFQSQSYAQTQGKDSSPRWELSEELRWELCLGSQGEDANQVPRLTHRAGLSIVEKLSGRRALQSTSSFWKDTVRRASRPCRGTPLSASSQQPGF